jgi:anti-sigma-K factor RskA
LLSPRWEFDDPLHFHRAHLATTQEVNSLVSTADARVSKRLTNADTLVAGWWRTAFIAVAAVLVLVAVAFGTFVWRGGRMPLTNEGR